jgi:hypothetical protein
VPEHVNRLSSTRPNMHRPNLYERGSH